MHSLRPRCRSILARYLWGKAARITCGSSGDDQKARANASARGRGRGATGSGRHGRHDRPCQTFRRHSWRREMRNSGGRLNPVSPYLAQRHRRPKLNRSKSEWTNVYRETLVTS